MTASSLRLMGARARERMRGRRLFGRGGLAIIAVLQMLMLLTPPFGGRALAEERIKGDVKITTDGGYARLAFRFEKEVPATVQHTYPIMVVAFKKPVDIAVDKLNTIASNYVSAARVDPDGMSIRIALARKVKVNSIPAAERLYVDLLPETWSGLLPGLPQEVVEDLARRALEAERQLRLQRIAAKTQKPSAIRVKVATQPTFTRYVFAMPDMANVVPENSDGKLTLEFDQAIKWDLADARAALPKTLRSIDADIEEDSVAVSFSFNGTPEVRTFREDRSIVVDVGHESAKPNVAAASVKPKLAEAAAMPKPAAAAPVAAPALTPPETMRAKDAATGPPPSADVLPPLVPAAAGAPSVAPAAAPPPMPQAEAPPAAAPASPPPTPTVEAPPAAAPASPAPNPVLPASPQPPAKSTAAEHKGPVPNPNGPVVVDLQQSGDSLRAEFPFAVETPAAVFQRADVLWLVFDSAAKIDLAALKAGAGHAIRSTALERGADGEAIVRIRLERPRLVSLAADGPGWIVTIGDTAAGPSEPLVIARNIVGKNRASLAIPFAHPRKIHVVTDRDVGDRLLVITALGPARGFLRAQSFVELRALPSTQGVVLQPLADDVSAELAVDKITITRPGGLSLSPTTIGPQGQQLAGNLRALSFGTQLWTYNRQANFNARQAELVRIAAMSPTSKRKEARLNLARFYLTRGMSAEAKAVLTVALADQKDAEDVTGTVLKGVAYLMLERPEETLKTLSNPLVGDQLDAPIWRAIADARLGKWADAQAAFKNVDSAISALPVELQRMALREALRTAIEVHDFNSADRIISELATIGVTPKTDPSVAVLVGRLKEALGRGTDALANYAIAVSFARPARRRARPPARGPAALRRGRHAAQRRGSRTGDTHHDMARRRDRSGRAQAARASLYRR